MPPKKETPNKKKQKMAPAAPLKREEARLKQLAPVDLDPQELVGASQEYAPVSLTNEEIGRTYFFRKQKNTLGGVEDEAIPHIRRRAWETGSVQAPLVIFNKQGENVRKGLWQSSASLPEKLLRPSPFYFLLRWPDDDGAGVVRLDRSSDPAMCPLFYTSEGYAYVPKKVVERSDDDRTAVIKYVEFWGWNWQPTRSPPRELLYKANLKEGSMHAPLYEGTFQEGKAPAPPRADFAIDLTRQFAEEVKTLELLNMTGSAHFVQMVGYPLFSSSGYLVHAEGERLDRTAAEWSYQRLLEVFQCLAKACAVMAWGSEDPEFPVKCWEQVVHLGLTKENVKICPANHVEHTCQGPVCVKITDVSACIRLPAGDIVHNPFEYRNGDGPVNQYRLIECERELILKENAYKGTSRYAPERALALGHPEHADGIERAVTEEELTAHIRGNYSWWTNVWAIGTIMADLYRDSNFGDEPRLGGLIARCTALHPHSRIPIPELLQEIAGLLSGCAAEHRHQVPDKPLHWEEDGQKMLIAACRDRVRRLVSSDLYSRREMGIHLLTRLNADLRGPLFSDDDQGMHVPASDRTRMPGTFQIRPDDRQKWDEVVRRVFVDENGKPAAERLELGMFDRREVSVGPTAEVDLAFPDDGESSEHEIDILYGAQRTDEGVRRRYAAKLGRWDACFWTG